jgi:hypothetical protein
MILMGLDDKVNNSILHVAKMKLDQVRDYRFSIMTLPYTSGQDQYIPFFESIIRYLGGLISAYHMTGNTILLSRADELGQRLLPAFNVTTGLPDFAINMKTSGITICPNTCTHATSTVERRAMAG